MATITSDDATILRPYYRMKFSEGTTGIHQHANRCSKFQRALVDRHLVAAFTTESQNSEQLFTCAENKPDTPVDYPAQHNNLVSERGIFGFKSALRLEWRDQDVKDKT